MGALQRTGGDNSVLHTLATGTRELKYEFPAMDFHVSLESGATGGRGGRWRRDAKIKAGDPQRADGRATGTHLWEASYVLAEWLSRQTRGPAADPTLSRILGRSCSAWDGWTGKLGVELGAGLGLPSVVAARLGIRMIATDDDDDVLDVLEQNALRNQPPSQGSAGSRKKRRAAAPHSSAESGLRVQRLLWSRDVSPSDLALDDPPDLLLAADVIYASAKSDLTAALLATLSALSGPGTLVIIANVRRFPVSHPNSENRFFEQLQDVFEHTEIPQHCLHKDFQRSGVGSCVIH